MRHRARLVVLLALPVAAALASSEPGAEDLDRNARLVERYRRDDPAYYERLRRDLRAFHRLPEERQEKLRRLDRALHEQDSATQKRLWAVLDRFSAWLERLPEKDRRRVEDAPTREERLRVIKELREQEFIRRLPKRERENLEKLSGEERAAEVARLREEERQVRLAWNPDGRPDAVALNPDRPVRPADLSADARTYLKEILVPMLSEKERAELRAAEGQWPLFARTLLELAEKHPVNLPPGRTPGPISPRDLKGEARAVFNELMGPGPKGMAPAMKQGLRQTYGKWPDFAKELTRQAAKHGHPIKPLAACRPDEFMPPVETFIAKELLPRLNPAEQDELAKALGKWPDYPEKVLALSKKHNLDVPMMRLPGARELWDRVRSVAELPEVPDRMLREFFAAELTPKERAELRVSPDDPESRDRLRKAFFERNPKWLTRQRDIDRKKALSGE
jgi:hypothetical protein